MPIFSLKDYSKNKTQDKLRKLARKAASKRNYNPDADPVLIEFQRKQDEIDRRFK